MNSLPSSLRDGVNTVVDYAITLFNNNHHEIEMMKDISCRAAKVAIPMIVLLSSTYLIADYFSSNSNHSTDNKLSQSDIENAKETGKREEQKVSAYRFFPPIEGDLTIPNKFIRNHSIKGIRVTEKAMRRAPPFTATWSPSKEPQPVNKKHFLEPVGCISLEIDAGNLPDEELLSSLLSKPHQINRLVLNGFTEEAITKAMANATLPKIDTLVINHTKMSEQGLQQILNKHKRIACFDVPKSDASELKKTYLVRDQNGDNFDERYAEMNTFLQMLIEGDIYQILSCFPSSEEPPFLHNIEGSQKIFPAARFITSFTAFSGSKIGIATLKTLFSRLKLCCPYINFLDLSNCDNITFEIIPALGDLALQRLSLRNCKNLYNRWSASEGKFIHEIDRCKKAFAAFYKSKVTLLDIKQNDYPVFESVLRIASVVVPSKCVAMTKDRESWQMSNGKSIKVNTSADGGNKNLSESGVGSASQNLINESLKVSKDNLPPALLVKEVVVVGGHDEGSSQTSDKVDGIAADKAPARNT